MTVLDSSALLAHLLGEPGAAAVQDRLGSGGTVGAVAWSEVMQTQATKGVRAASRGVLLSSPIRIEPFGRDDAEGAARPWQRGSGLSLADRLCLTLGERLDAEVLTADRAWAGRPRVTVVR